MRYIWQLELDIGEVSNKEEAYRKAYVRLKELAQDGFLGLAREGGLILVGEDPPRLRPFAKGVDANAR